MRELETVDDLAALAGQEVGMSDWIAVTQARVNTFADATDDHQWIHVDAERACRETQFGGTIAHGFLTLALLPAMLESALRVRQLRMIINYGVNKVRFPAPLLVGSRVRGRFTLASTEPAGDGTQFVWTVLVEAEGQGKPVCAAELLVRLYP
jgi:acyl dehydratase